jgi:hypothetical protein
MSGMFAEKTGLQVISFKNKFPFFNFFCFENIMNVYFKHSVLENPVPFGLPSEFTLMPQHFKNHGYKTYMVGK